MSKTRYRILVSLLGVVLVSPLLVTILGGLFFPLPDDALFADPSVMVMDRTGKILRVFTSDDEMCRVPAPLSEISPNLVQAVVTVEDRWFSFHAGVNPFSIARAAVTNLKAGEIVTGGSTLTMQVARLMEPKPRTFKSKLIEVFRALQLELRFTKDEILELYFNMAPYGGNIVGSAAASQIYFDKQQKDLTLGEAALLAAIPNSPSRLRPDAAGSSAVEGRKKVLSRMLECGLITGKEYREALSEALPTSRFSMPFRAPHLARYLAERYPAQPRIASTLDADIQSLTRRLLEEHMTPLSKRGISQAAAVVMDTKTREVLALVGSVDFFDTEKDGQVNGAFAPRSPGSTLKPFAYAMALDAGLLSPQSLLTDVPVDYSGFRPQNYDERHRGLVTLEEALTHSLNVPAVNVCAILKGEGLYSFLKKGGLTTLEKPREYYGLSLVLGGCEVTLAELTSLYAGLANGGEFAPYRLVLDETSTASTRLLGEGTCFIVTEILAKLSRPDFPHSWESALHLPKVAWKTGTSYGHKDAWSIGYSPRFTVGVWVGNFEGTGAPGLVGAEAAAPLLFAIFNGLTQSLDKRWFTRPDVVRERDVCAVSGMIPTAHCPAVKKEYYIPGKSPHLPCTVHRQYTIDKKTGERLCSRCRPGREYSLKVFEVWPPEIATWMERNGMSVDRIPAHFHGCTEMAAGDGPLIRSPSDNSEYVIRDGVDLEHQKILLEASASNSTRRLYWFLDSKLIFEGEPRERFFLTPERGEHILMCVDEEGRSTEIALTVR
jgi:penicillin-binding protein 1C